jgi:hypothetical protein
MSLPFTLDYSVETCPGCGSTSAVIGLIMTDDHFGPVYALDEAGNIITDEILDDVSVCEISLTSDEITELVNRLNDIKIRLLREERLAALGRPFD